MSGYRSEDCWASARHLNMSCTMKQICECITLERDALRVEVEGLRSEIARLHAMNLALSERCEAQAEILSRNAETKANA